MRNRLGWTLSFFLLLLACEPVGKEAYDASPADGGEDPGGGCYCSICAAECLPIEQARGEECPVPEPWRHDWCDQAVCGKVNGVCQLIGPEPVVDKDVIQEMPQVFDDVEIMHIDVRHVDEIGYIDVAWPDGPVYDLELYELPPNEAETYPDMPLYEDSWPSCVPGDGCFMDPCTENADCMSGWCMSHLGAGVCTQMCVEECPPGWVCAAVASQGPDLVFLCISQFATLCQPCVSSDDCMFIGPDDSQGKCISFGGEGSFCGSPCGNDSACPWGFACQEVAVDNGTVDAYCVPESGTCPCTKKSAMLGLQTECFIQNDYGACFGLRTCTEDGLSPCDAPVPAAETCNGKDDDCDGQPDEGAGCD
jgi:hypothetical protein